MTTTHSPNSLVNAPVWEHGSLELICQRVQQETSDVTSFTFQSAQGHRFDFKPGQFITLELNIEGKTLHRSYTISSSPSRPYMLTLTIKRVPGGIVSNWLCDHLKTGSKIRATAPAGVFNLIDIPAKRTLFLSAGCGITPMMSMSRWVVDSCADIDIRFIHSARTAEDIIFYSEVQLLSEQSDLFQPDVVLENKDGFLDINKLQELVPDLHSRTIYVCGPTAYMEAVEKMVADTGFNMSNYHFESFGGEVMQQVSSKALDKASEQTYHVSLELSGKAVEAGSDELVIDILENQQAPIVAACRAGVCGACKVEIIDGEVESSSQMTLTPEEIERGYILSCCSKPKSALKINI